MVLITAAASLVASGPVAQAGPSAGTRLVSVAKKHPRRSVVAIVQFNAGVSERRARALVRSHRGRVTDRLPAINGFAIRLPARQARKLRGNGRVLNVTLNTSVENTSLDSRKLQMQRSAPIGGAGLSDERLDG